MFVYNDEIFPFHSIAVNFRIELDFSLLFRFVYTHEDDYGELLSLIAQEKRHRRVIGNLYITRRTEKDGSG